MVIRSLSTPVRRCRANAVPNVRVRKESASWVESPSARSGPRRLGSSGSSRKSPSPSLAACFWHPSHQQPSASAA
jgi:hypothetical protein